MQNQTQQSAPIQLGYWKIRGLSNHVQAVLKYLNLPYELTQYETGDAPEFSRDSWLNVKFTLGYDLPNLPYLQDGEVKITDTKAIILYLANKYDRSLFGKDEKDFGLTNMLLNKLHEDIKWPLAMLCYNTEDKENLKNQCIIRLESISGFLGNKKFLLGDYVTCADLYAIETLDFADSFTGGLIFEKYPNLKTYLDNLNNLKQIKNWKNSEQFMKTPFNNKRAKINM